jgi:hypothetical protein
MSLSYYVIPILSIFLFVVLPIILVYLYSRKHTVGIPVILYNKQFHEKSKNKEKMWLCPICGYWIKHPQAHLIKKHNVSNDMVTFWVEKGKWI